MEVTRLKRKPTLAQQVAALPLRMTKDGRFEMLMVTSRENKRWVLPKGWPMAEKSLWEAAEIEALEEAGATGAMLEKAAGSYRYRKVRPELPDLPCEVTVFAMIVTQLQDRWKEKGERQRKWFKLSDAAKRVWEADLRALLRKLDKKQATKTLVAEFGQIS